MYLPRFIFGILGNLSALVLFLAPMVTMRRIVRSKSTERFSGVPYLSTLLNCLLCGWYGLPFISPNNTLVSTVNGAGIVLEIVYVTIFLVYARDIKYRAKLLGYVAFVAAAFGVVAVVSVGALDKKKRKIFCGIVSAIFSICMYASPLSVMMTVIRTKSVEYMPFLLSFSVFLCSACWFLYGLLGFDFFVFVPNGVGFLLGALQLMLYFTFKYWRVVPVPDAEKLKMTDTKKDKDIEAAH